jgi:hypothetical protein
VNYRNSLTRDSGIQMAFCVPGILTLGDLEDVLRFAAPRALLIQAAEGDKWSQGAQAMFDHARSASRKRSVSGPVQAAARVASNGCQFQGRSSAIRRAGWSAMRTSTSVR